MFNAGVLAFVMCPMGSASSGKSMYSMSSGAMTVNLGGAFALNYGVNGGTNSYS